MESQIANSWINRDAARDRFKANGYLFIAVGLLAVQLILNRPFNEDEASLALSISQRSFRELLAPLAFGQVAPIGFLMVEKVGVTVFGDHDWAYRIPSAAVACLILYRAKNVPASRSARQFFVLLLFLNPIFLRYACEVKPYIIDAFISILLLSCLVSGERGAIPTILAIGAWFSNIVFIAVVPAALLYLSSARPIRRSDVIRWSVCGLSLGIYYEAFVRTNSNRTGMVTFWVNAGGLYEPGRSYWGFLYRALLLTAESVKPLYDLFYVLNLTWFAALGILLLGVYGLRNQVGAFFALLFLTHLLFSSLGLYPFETRLIVYFIPFVSFLVATLKIGYLPRYGLLGLATLSFARQPIFPFTFDNTRDYVSLIVKNGYRTVYAVGGTTGIAWYYVKSYGYPLAVTPIRKTADVTDARTPILIIRYRYQDFDSTFLARYRRIDTMPTLFGRRQTSGSGLFLPPGK